MGCPHSQSRKVPETNPPIDILLIRPIGLLRNQTGNGRKTRACQTTLCQALRHNPNLSRDACWDKTKRENPSLFGDSPSGGLDGGRHSRGARAKRKSTTQSPLWL